MRAVITGITGFAGSHLAEHLLAQGHEVWGILRQSDSTEKLRAFRSRIELFVSELEARPLAERLAPVRPDAIFHLAGQAHVGYGWHHREETYHTNVLGTVAVLEAARALLLPPKVLLVSSGEVYGQKGSPFAEDRAAEPDTPYALSKTIAETVALTYHRWDGLPVIIARAFNHTGPRQAPSFVCSEFARTMALIAMGKKEPRIDVGNLEARRDFSDVRDIVRGYELSVARGSLGRIYNLCSGSGVAVRQVLEILLPMAGKPVEVVVDPTRFRPLDTPEIVGDPTRARDELGFEPEHDLRETLRDLFHYWMAEPPCP